MKFESFKVKKLREELNSANAMIHNNRDYWTRTCNEWIERLEYAYNKFATSEYKKKYQKAENLNKLTDWINEFKKEDSLKQLALDVEKGQTLLKAEK